MALVASGFVAGRGPSAALPEQRSIDLGEPFRDPSPPRLLAASAVLLAALLTAWAVWQPLAADRETSDALELAEGGDVDGAIAKSQAAADTNPLTAEPLLVEAAIAAQAGRDSEAARVVIRPPAIETSSAGMAVTRPSPMVRIV